MPDAPTFLSLFAGIGGFDLALERAGFRCAGQVELDPFCTRVLAARWPHAPRWADVREWQGNWHEPPDLLVGRKRDALGFAANENSRGDFSSIGRESAGRSASAIDLLVGGFPCQDFSVAGKRAGLVGYRGTLFWEIVRIAKEVKPRWGLFENVPGLLSSRHGRDFWAVLQGLRECWPAVGWRILDSRHFGVPQRRRRVFLVCGPSEAAVASVLFESEGGGGDSEASHESLPHLTAHTRKGPDSDCTEMNLVVGPLRTNPYNNSDPAMEKKQHGEGMGLSDQDVMYTLQAGAEHGIAIAQNQRGEVLETDYAHQLTAGGGKPGEGYPAVRIEASVRRLTPMECERLQSFPDGWTCLCQPLEAYAKDAEQAAWDCKCPDGSRYRALGNAVTVSVAEWIGRRLMEALNGQMG